MYKQEEKPKSPYTAPAYTPAYEALLLNLTRVSSPLLAFDVAGMQDKAIVYQAPTTIGRHGGKDHYPVQMARAVLLQWLAVGLVTITEAYLQDALIFMAERDSTVMKESKQTATYRDVADATSLEDLLATLRAQWARGILERSGPARWISRFERLGVRGFAPTDSLELEELWGVRHSIVHGAGNATRDFVARHASFGASIGQPLEITRAHLKQWMEPMVRLCENVERYCYNRFLRGKNGDKSTTTTD